MTFDQVGEALQALGTVGALVFILWMIIRGELHTTETVRQAERFAASETARADRAEQRNSDLIAALNRVTDQVERMRELREARESRDAPR